MINIHNLRVHGVALEASSQLVQLHLLRLLSSDDVGWGEVLLDRVRALLWRLIRSADAAAADVAGGVGSAGDGGVWRTAG